MAPSPVATAPASPCAVELDWEVVRDQLVRCKVAADLPDEPHDEAVEALSRLLMAAHRGIRAGGPAARLQAILDDLVAAGQYRESTARALASLARSLRVSVEPRA